MVIYPVKQQVRTNKNMNIFVFVFILLIVVFLLYLHIKKAQKQLSTDTNHLMICINEENSPVVSHVKKYNFIIQSLDITIMYNNKYQKINNIEKLDEFNNIFELPEELKYNIIFEDGTKEPPEYLQLYQEDNTVIKFNINKSNKIHTISTTDLLYKIKYPN